MKCIQHPPPCKLAGNAMEHSSKQKSKKTTQLFDNSQAEQSLAAEEKESSGASV